MAPNKMNQGPPALGSVDALLHPQHCQSVVPVKHRELQQRPLAPTSWLLVPTCHCRFREYWFHDSFCITRHVRGEQLENMRTRHYLLEEFLRPGCIIRRSPFSLGTIQGFEWEARKRWWFRRPGLGPGDSGLLEGQCGNYLQAMVHSVNTSSAAAAVRWFMRRCRFATIHVMDRWHRGEWCQFPNRPFSTC
jgi:hypothetical protein